MSTRPKAHGRPVLPHSALTPGLYILEIRHDDDCPTIRTLRIDDCTCSQVEEVLVRWEDQGRAA